MDLLNHPAAFFARFHACLQQPLPGEAAQNQMTAHQREPIAVYLNAHPDHRRSAVLMTLYPHKGELHTLLIRRPSYQGVHSGQLALPGGAEEPEDATPAHTALREAREEVGLNAGIAQVMGALTPLYIPPSNFLVQPFVARLDQRPEWIPSSDEVEELLEIPLRTFLDPALKERRRIEIAQRITIDAPCYIINGHVLWGATAMMFSELEAILTRLE
jgi:8-oxo-dGTP pyrophosphatase MutT (NUDIX family)